MAIPSITLAPSSGDEANLPIAVTVTGTNIFERPNYTDRELFDVVDSRWKGGATQGLGVIGDSFVGNGTDAYWTESFIHQDQTFVGFAVFVKMNSGASLGRIMDFSNNSQPGAFDCYIDSSGKVGAIAWGETGTSVERKNILTIEAIPFDTWTSIIAYVDLSAPTDTPRIFINGVEATYTINDNDSFSLLNEMDHIHIGADFYLGGVYNFFDGDICNAYWSLDSDFKNKVAEYANLPTVELN